MDTLTQAGFLLPAAPAKPLRACRAGARGVPVRVGAARHQPTHRKGLGLLFCLTPRLIPEKAVFRPALVLSFLPGLNGTDMTKMSYSEQLKHPNWQRKRLEVMKGAGFACENCGDTETMLNVHHRRYVKGRMVWEYENNELQCLCQPCHAQHHEHRELLERLLMDGEGREQMAIGLMGGYCTANLEIGEGLDDAAQKVGGHEFLAGAVAGMLWPRGAIGWPEIASAIRSLLAGTQLNPAEEQLLALMESLKGND